jgi:light-regulated signal transduction histidine kinase (bacteriophytochrome)
VVTETPARGETRNARIVSSPLRNRAGEVVAAVEMVEDITAQRRAEEQVRQTLAELERSNAELEQFAYVASHDLQEPLRKVLAFGARLEARCGDALDEQGLDYLERMGNACERMRELINDLLMYSRITTRAQPFVPVALGEVARDVLSDLEALVEETGGRVELGELPTIDADALQMRQLLQNLIGNALKFHPDDEPPVVKVYGEPAEDRGTDEPDGPSAQEMCRVVVADKGIGFEERHLDRMFGVFQRLHGRGKYEGTGIGLAICRKIAERHGGSITARSAPGEGSTFIMTLPINHIKAGDAK